MTSNLYEFNRTSGQWSNWGEKDSGSEFNDIVWSPSENMFYIVGQSSGQFADAWGWSYAAGGSWYDYPPCTSGMFHAVEYAQAGDAPYIFIAVGEEFGAPNKALIASYVPATWNIEGYEYGNPNGDILYDIAWDCGGDSSYLTAGYEGDTGYGVVYWLGAPVTLAQDIGLILNWSAIPVINAMDWCPSGSYGILVGNPGGPGVGNVLKLENTYAQPGILCDSTETLNDVDWFPDTSKAVIVGEHGGNGVVLIHHANTNEVVDISGKLPPGTGPLYGIACKGPTSPASSIILGASGAIGFFPQAVNTNTQIRVNSAFPHIFDIDFWDEAPGAIPGISLLNTEVDSDHAYTFFIEANYTVGGAEYWNDAEVELCAWYDEGKVGSASAPEGSWSTAENRTRQFRLFYNVNNNTAWMDYPSTPPFEFSILNWWEDPNVYGIPGWDFWHHLYINVTFEKQTWAADGNGFPNLGAADINLINSALLDVYSWDFNYSVYDSAMTSARNESFEEFGIKQAVQIIVSGNPSGNAPPGSSDVPLLTPSTIIYSANTNYSVNVSIPNLLKDGTGPDFIPASDIAVRNEHVNASYVYSDINYTVLPTGRNFLGPGIEYCVWGNSTTNMIMPTPLNGTVTAGVWHTDYNSFGVDDFTLISWWATVVVGTPEGVYWATITFSIEDS